jgi:hypothetical protein
MKTERGRKWNQSNQKDKLLVGKLTYVILNGHRHERSVKLMKLLKNI